MVNGLYLDNNLINKIVDMCSYSLLLLRTKKGKVSLYQKEESSTMSYDLNFPTIKVSFIDKNGFRQDHCLYVGEIENRSFSFDNKENKSLFYRTVINNKPRMENYEELKNLINYFDKRIDSTSTRNLCNTSDKNETKEFLQFSSLFVRAIKVLNNCEVSIIKRRSSIQLYYYSYKENGNKDSGFSLIFDKKFCKLNECFINGNMRFNLESRIEYSNCNDEMINNLFKNLETILSELRVQFFDKMYE